MTSKWGRVGGWGLGWLLGALALAGLGGPVAADKEGEKVALPADLARIPSTGMIVASVRLADVWNGALGKGMREQAAKDLKEDLTKLDREFEKSLGVAPGQVERLTLFALDNNLSEVTLLLSAKGPYDRAKVLAAYLPGAKEETVEGKTVFVGPRERRAAHFINERAFVLGSLHEVRSLLSPASGKREDGVGPAVVAAASGKHSVVVGVNLALFGRLAEKQLPPEWPFKSLLKARSGVLTMGLGATVKADLRLAFADAEDAKVASKALQAAQKLGEMALAAGIQEMVKNKAPAELVGLLRQAESALQGAPVKQSGALLTASGEIKGEQAPLGSAVAQMIQMVREAAARAQRSNNLKQIGLAMHNYESAMGALPASAIYNKDGKALLSWRVLVLPYIEENVLYNEFKLNEPWDSAHNKKLLARMPRTYANPSVAAPLGMTYVQGLVGPGAIFEGKRGIRFVDITDGTSNTLMAVEAAKAVPWTKPEDLKFVPAGPLPARRASGKGFLALFCDGSVRYFKKAPRDATFRGLITRNGGEVLPADPDK